MTDENETEKSKPLVDPMRISYPGNSNKSKKEKPKDEKKVERVVEAEVVIVKPSLSKRMRQAFTGDDARSVFDYLLFEVAVPALKSTISDLASQGVERMLFGDASRRVSGNRRMGGRVDYNVISTNRGAGMQREEPRNLSQRDRATHNFQNVIIATRPEAENVLRSLIDLVDQYGQATVSDFYDCVGITGSFADDKWGWFNLDGADIIRDRQGFIVELPPTKPIS